MSIASRNNPILEAVRTKHPGVTFREVYEDMTGFQISYPGCDDLAAVWDAVARNDRFQEWIDQANAIVNRLANVEESMR